MNRLQTATTDWRRIADTDRTYRLIPMCGNVQLIFYHWTYQRQYWTDTMKHITPPEEMKL